MRDDNNPLRDIDLSAWEAPAPRTDLADAVVARMREVAAVSPVTTTIVVPPSRRRWLVAGTLAAVCASIAVVIIVLAGSNREDAHGSVTVADRAQHLDLDTISAELDPGADVRWQRDHQTVHVEQPRGTATWKVDSDTQLLIDPGAMGASIEATGASLRVEVQMNHADGRVIAASATTAAIAAIVTVIVYEGHVNVRNSGQTITVAPGSTVEIAPNQPPREPFAVGLARIDDVVARITEAHNNASPVLSDCQFSLMQMKWVDVRDCAARHLADNPTAARMYADRAEVEMTTELQMAKIRDLVAMARWDEARHVADTTAMHSMQHYKVERLVADVPCGAADLVASAERDIHYGLFGDALVKLEKNLTCKPDPAIDARAIFAACEARAEVHAGAYLATRASSDGITVGEYCDRNGAPSGPATVAASCDPQLPHDQGIAAVNLGQYATALLLFEQALACKPSQDTIRLAYLAACHSKNASKARDYFAKLPSVQQTDVKPICERDGIDPASAPTCDASALHDQGVHDVNLGQYAAALSAFEQSLACKSSPDTIRLAYLAACQSKNVPKARAYLGKLPVQQQAAMKMICERAGISLATAPTCDATALHDKGVDAVNLGQYAAALSLFEQALKCKPSSDDVRLAYMSACNSKNASKARIYFDQLPAKQQTDLKMICARNGITVGTSSCDADALRNKGIEGVNLGQYAAALTTFEQALACKSSPDTTRLAYLAACHSKNVSKARLYFSKLPPAQQRDLKTICEREGIDVDGCDASKLKDKGVAFVDLGSYAEALTQFEQSLACKSDGAVARLAYLAACHAKAADKARQYFSLIPPSHQAADQQICAREGIDVAATCNAADLHDKGITSVTMGQYAAALALFEQSYACKADPTVIRLEYMAACHAKNAQKARLYYGKLPAVTQRDVQALCLRDGIQVP